MKSAHPHLNSDNWWFNLQNQAVREALEAVEAASMLPASKQLPKTLPEPVKYVSFCRDCPIDFVLSNLF